MERQEKLFDAITLIEDELISQSDRYQTMEGEQVKRRWKSRIKWRVAVILLLMAGFGCLMLWGDQGKTRPTGFEQMEVFDGEEPIPVEKYFGSGLGGITTTDYATAYYPAGQGPKESPVKDNSTVKKLSVYRSMAAKSSDDTYQLLKAWIQDLEKRAKELGIVLNYDMGQIVYNTEKYDPSEPIDQGVYPLYNLWIDMDYGGSKPLQLMCWSEGAVTYYSLKGIGKLYEFWSGEVLQLPANATEEMIIKQTKPLVDFANRLTGACYDVEAPKLMDVGTDTPFLDYQMPPENGSMISRGLYQLDGVSRSRITMSYQKGVETLALRYIGITIEYLEYLGEYPLISPEEAKELLEQGYFFGGVQCPLCRMDNEPVEFSTEDPYQVEYYTNLTEYKLPYYAFYHHVGQYQFDPKFEGVFPETNDLAEEYAVVYVPAVKVEGLEDYFARLAENHQAGGH